MKKSTAKASKTIQANKRKATEGETQIPAGAGRRLSRHETVL